MSAKVSVSFGKSSDVELDNFAQAVIDSMTSNATYPTPPVTMANLQTAKDDFTTKIAAAQARGPADTAVKNNSLLGMLRNVVKATKTSDAAHSSILTCLTYVPRIGDDRCYTARRPQGQGVTDPVLGL